MLMVMTTYMIVLSALGIDAPVKILFIFLSKTKGSSQILVTNIEIPRASARKEFRVW